MRSLGSATTMVGQLPLALWLAIVRDGGQFGLCELQAPDNGKAVRTRVIDLPRMGARYTSRPRLADVEPDQFVPSSGESAVIVHFPDGAVPTVDALCCLPAALGDALFGARSSISPGAPGMTVLALQVTSDPNHDIDGAGLQCVLDTVTRACGPGQHRVCAVVVTDLETASSMDWTKPLAVDPDSDAQDARVNDVPQFVLIGSEHSVFGSR